MPNVLEQIEWAMINWWNANDADKPRVLIVGDSITVGYGEKVHNLIKDRYVTGRLATSKCIDNPSFLSELDYMLREFPYETIHFNNGLHGWACTENEFAEAYPRIIDHIRKAAPASRIVIASSTAVRDASDLSRFNDTTNPRVIARNEIMKACAYKCGIQYNDLYALTAAHPEYYCPDAVHMVDAGYNALAAQVAKLIARG